MSIKTISIIPFTNKDYPLLEIFRGLQDEYHISHIISPNGVALPNKDVSIIGNRIDMGYDISVDMNLLLCTDSVLITHVEMDTALYRYALKAIDLAVKAGKDIICFMRLNQGLFNEIRKSCETKNACFTYAFDDSINMYDQCYYEEKEIYIPKVPVIAIGELSDRLDSDEIAYKVMNAYEDKGYRVLGFSNNLYGALRKNVKRVPLLHGTNADVVYRYSHYIKSAIYESKPDIVIMQYPKPMMAYSDDIPYDFGINAYILSKAISHNCFICCGTFCQLNESFWDEVEASILHKFGFSIDIVHISNKVIDIDNNASSDKLIYNSVTQYQTINALSDNRFIRNFENITAMNDNEIFSCLNNIINNGFYSLS